MFGMNFNRAPKQAPAPSEEMIRPTKTDEAALELLREKVDAVVNANPGQFSALTDKDIEMVVNALAVTQEKTGTPYTVEFIEDFEEGLPEEAAEILMQRIGARGEGAQPSA